ncbi:nuclease domain-containing protein [Pectobacterium brasiliense]|uniref:nuclease domain-containing protein n=1 Tax=Pectobacterium brasiliense TaxID=180957 RepID=UPI00209D830C|nr:nuclease domain-containing protein [Pectobacterium brasiliense]
MIKKFLVFKSKASGEFVRGDACILHISGICNGNHQITVLCHLSSSTHCMGYNFDDFWAIYDCPSCHDVIDGRGRGKKLCIRCCI